MIRNVTFAQLLGTAILAVGAPASAKDKVDPSTYPELAPAVLLPAIVAELRHTLPDVFSVREMKLCPAGFIKLRDGKPVGWSVQLQFNTKNEAGGYTGLRRYTAIFRNGRVAYPIRTSDFVGREGLYGVFNRMIDKQMASCQAVSESTIAPLLTSD